MNENNNKRNLKIFFIKLFSITLAIIVGVNLLFNSIFADRLEKIDKILLLNKNQSKNEIKDKIRKELRNGLKNENLFSEEDRILLYKLYLKMKKEFDEIDKSNL